MGPKKSHDGYRGQNTGRDSSWNVDNPNRYGQYGHSEEQGQQQQEVKQMQRSSEASKQMLYTVFSNVVAILEEYEARTQANPVKRSNLALPDQSGKTVEDVESIVQTQLLLFQKMQRATPEKVNKSVNKELRQKTIHWAAVRAEQQMPSNTDKYICQLYEVLAKGETVHGFLEEPMEPVTAETLRENFQHIFKGKHDASVMDREFKNDENKKATSPQLRKSEEAYAFQCGVARMEGIMGDLKPHLDRDVRMFAYEDVGDDMC